MKKFISIAIILLGAFFCLPVFAEEIKTFDATISINPDATINVSEKITYDFGLEQKHGIYRDIPVEYMARGGKFNLRLTDISVTDENSSPINFSESMNGNYKRIKIGDADVTISGVKEYSISYKVSRAMNFFSDYDELYWNVTGNEWESQINESRATINLPASVNDKEIKSNCYAGPVGSTNSCISDRFVYSSQDQINQIVFTHDRLDPKEGLTVVVGLPKGVLSQPSQMTNAVEVARDNWIVILPIIALLGLFWRWRKVGRDPIGRGTIVAQFDAPDNLNPAEISALVDEKVENKDVSAEIINLAVKGYLKINYIDGKGIFKKKDYELEKLKEPDDKLNEYEKKIISSLFGSSSSVKLSDLKDEFYKDLQDIKKKIYQTVTDKGYFVSNPNKIRLIYYAIGIAIIVSSFLLMQFFGIIGIVSMVITGVLVFIFGRIMPAKTEKGVLAKEYILGLKQYLQVAEKDRLEYHNAPEKKPELFEKLLPFALVLGVSAAWAKQFEGIYNKQPNWYNDPAGMNFSAIVLANNLNSFESKAATALASAPGGNSGFSGGGAGGGFGGGGGGSW